MYILAAFMGFLAIPLWMGKAEVSNNQGEVYDEHVSRHTRYSLKNYKWAWQTISVKIVKYTPQLPKEDVDISVQIALEQYAAVTSLKFRLIESGPANIIITFWPKGSVIPELNRPLMAGKNQHEAAVTASRWDPTMSMIESIIYFDEAVTWKAVPSITGRSKCIFYNIALHELGHALGLGHSHIEQAIMYSYAISGVQGPFDTYWSFRVGMNVLIDDDIKAIQQHYPPLWREATINTMTKCEGKTLNLNCPKDQFLHIVTTEYGNNEHWDQKEKCEYWKDYANCAYITSTVANRCNKKNNCSIYVSTENVMPSTLGDPCEALSKTLRVRYVCTTRENLGIQSG